MNLWDKLTAASTLASRMWQWDGASFRQRTYGDIVAEARHVAAGLRMRGVEPGSVVPAVITNGPDAITGVIGALFAGASVASLPIIARGMSIPAYCAQLTRLCEFLGVDFLLAEERFLVFMDSQTRPGVSVIGYRSLIDAGGTAEVSPPPLDATMLIQFSSGTTGEPHGVELSGNAIAAHMAALSKHLRIDPELDIGYTWLPLSHDMGLFGCGALAWYNGMPGVISAPERFLT
jgi:acyl-CoA synthetase (AMP-forming)/AMP-acid ligase II